MDDQDISSQDPGTLLSAILQKLETELGQSYHDLSNPLSVISGNIQLLEQLLVMTEGCQDLEEPIQDIKKACDTMLEASDRLVLLRASIKNVRGRAN